MTKLGRGAARSSDLSITLRKRRFDTLSLIYLPIG